MQAIADAKSDLGREKISKRFLSQCIGEVIDNNTLIFNEYNLEPQLVPRSEPGTWFENSISSGLG